MLASISCQKSDQEVRDLKTFVVTWQTEPFVEYGFKGLPFCSISNQAPARIFFQATTGIGEIGGFYAVEGGSATVEAENGSYTVTEFQVINTEGRVILRMPAGKTGVLGGPIPVTCDINH